MIECSACGARVADDARFCASCGARLSPTDEHWAREQRKTVTAVFTDIVGSTALATLLGRDAIRILDTTDGTLEQADVYVAFGEVHRVLGNIDEARDAWVEALARYEAKGAAPFVRQIRVRLAKLSGG